MYSASIKNVILPNIFANKLTYRYRRTSDMCSEIFEPVILLFYVPAKTTPTPTLIPHPQHPPHVCNKSLAATKSAPASSVLKFFSSIGQNGRFSAHIRCARTRCHADICRGRVCWRRLLFHTVMHRPAFPRGLRSKANLVLRSAASVNPTLRRARRYQPSSLTLRNIQHYL